MRKSSRIVCNVRRGPGPPRCCGCGGRRIKSRGGRTASSQVVACFLRTGQRRKSPEKKFTIVGRSESVNARECVDYWGGDAIVGGHVRASLGCLVDRVNAYAELIG